LLGVPEHRNETLPALANKEPESATIIASDFVVRDFTGFLLEF
jgi:hypothetical protein